MTDSLKKTATKIVNIYTLLLMVVFPLFMTDSYYNIQQSKLYFYLYSTILATVLVVLCMLYGKVTGKWEDGTVVAANAGKAAGKAAANAAGKHEEAAKAPLWRRFCAAMRPGDWFALLFAGAVVLSTVCSEWKYEAFWGNMGRNQGCFILLWYVVTYFLISRFYKVRKWHIDLFVAAGLVVCVWGVLDCYWKSPLGWQILHEHGNEKAFDFSSTFGNVNVLTAAEGMYLMAASAMFIGERKPVRSVFYYVAACAAFMGLVCGCSDNALISVAAAICFLPFFSFGSMEGIVRYAALLPGYLAGMLFAGWIGHMEGQRVVIRWKWGELLVWSMEKPDSVRLAFIAALLLFGVLAVVYMVYRRKSAGAAAADNVNGGTQWKAAKPLRTLWALLGVLAACALIWVFYDANHGGHPELYAPYRKILILNDAWGTHRGYNWSLAMKYFRDFPLIKKLVGSGPETYGIFTHVYDHYAMIEMFQETYDSPHNEWLQYLFTTGILGFVGYYGMVKCALWNGFGIGKKKNTDEKWLCGAAMCYALMAYSLQSFVNISIPVIVPMVIMVIGVCASIDRE